MGPYREREYVEIDGREVAVYDRSVELLLKVEQEGRAEPTIEEILRDATSLKMPEIETLDSVVIDFLLDRIVRLESRAIKKNKKSTNRKTANVRKIVADLLVNGIDCLPFGVVFLSYVVDALRENKEMEIRLAGYDLK
jgi:hypothetical protein